MKKLSITNRIEGTPLDRMIREFALNSGLFQIFLVIYIISSEEIFDLVSNPANYLLLIFAILQTWIIEKFGEKYGWKSAFFLLITPIIYSSLDIALEGWNKFHHLPYHIVYWGFSLFLVILTLWKKI